MDYQNPIDKLWRSLLSSPNQLALARVLKENLVKFLELAERADILVLHRDDLRTIEEVAHDLPRICPLIFSRIYGGSATSRGQSVRQICRQLQESGIDKRLGLKKRQLDQIRRRMQDLIPASSNLLHARNVAAHEHYSIDDPGFALILAGSIIRTYEVAEISDKQAPQFDKMIQIADELTKACTGLIDLEGEETTGRDAPINSEAQSAEVIALTQQILDRLNAIEVIAAAPSTNKPAKGKTGKITASDLGPKYVVGQFKRLAADMTRQISTELRSLPTTDEIDALLRDAVKKVARQNQGHQDFNEQTRQMLQNMHSSIGHLRKSLDTQDVNPALEAFYEEKLEPHMAQIKELSDRLKSTPDRTKASFEAHDSWPDDSDTELSEEDLSDVPFTDTPPSLTAQQAKNQLYLLRNRIQDEMDAAGKPIEYWENIVQGPIISKMLKERTLNLKDWKKVPLIAEKYGTHKKVMRKQLKKYSDDMLSIMNQIADWTPPKYE